MSAYAVASLLRKLTLFSDLNDKELDLLALVMRMQDFRAGQVICNEGETGQCCYFIASGEVEVHKAISPQETRTIATLRNDQAFGHIALIDSGVRSATCIATKPTRTLVLERADFDTLFSSGSRFAFRFQDVVAPPDRVAAPARKSAAEPADGPVDEPHEAA
jgi:CRP/FNR family cyclic AMP-dependent transcriptional regulator